MASDEAVVEGHESESAQRRKVAEDLRRRGVDPWDPPRFVPTHSSRELLQLMPPAEDASAVAEAETATFRLAGRMVSKRRQGKVGFFHLQDQSGRLQGHIRKDLVGDDLFELYKDSYVGDWIGIEGGLFRTKTGETTLMVRRYVILSKSLHPLPEKWHGLKDQEVRYRQRYLDLAVNEHVRETFVKRSLLVREIRHFLDERGFLEVENPTLHTLAGGAEARPFVTHHNTLGQDLFLRIAHELHLKRLLVGGLERVYELGKVFRNEGVSPRHNPEFTLLEAYWAHAGHEDWMDTTEVLFRRLAQVARHTNRFPYKGAEIDLGKPWRRLGYDEALRQHAGVSLDDLRTREDAIAQCRRLKVAYEPDQSHGKLIDNLFGHFVDPHLWEPTFIYDYPIPLSPLARRKPGSDFLALRFEGYIARMEVCNSFTELIDPIDQRERLEAQAAAKAGGDEEAHAFDEDFVTALEHAMPPAGGIGFGLDRLFMILLDAESIRDVILFPHMRTVEEGAGADAGSDADAGPDAPGGEGA